MQVSKSIIRYSNEPRITGVGDDHFSNCAKGCLSPLTLKLFVLTHVLGDLIEDHLKSLSQKSETESEMNSGAKWQKQHLKANICKVVFSNRLINRWLLIEMGTSKEIVS